MYKLYIIFKKEDKSLVYNILQLTATYILEDNYLRNQIQLYYNKDTTVIYIYKTIESGFTIENKIIYFYRKVYIPNQITKEFVTE